MSSRLTSRKRLAVVSLVAAVVASLGALAPAPASAAPAPSGCSATPDKCFSFSIVSDPSPPVQGQSATWTGTLKNLSKNAGGLQLGSANLTLDPGFSDIVAGTSSVGTESVSGNVVQLRSMSLQPNRSMTFSFTAKAPFEPSSCMFSIAAKQSNDFNGTGNNLTNVGGDGCSNVAVASTCTLLPIWDVCASRRYDLADGITVTAAGSNSAGGPSQTAMSVTAKPLAVPRGTIVDLQIHVELGGSLCPVTGCRLVASVDTKFHSAYTIAADALTMTINCGSLCGPLDPVYHYNDATAQVWPQPFCTPLSTAFPDPATGSYACHDVDSAPGTVAVHHMTYLDDYKVMVAGVPIG